MKSYHSWQEGPPVSLSKNELMVIIVAIAIDLFISLDLIFYCYGTLHSFVWQIIGTQTMSGVQKC